MEHIDLNRAVSPPNTPPSMGYDGANITYITENELPVTLEDSSQHIGTPYGNPNVTFHPRPFLYRPQPVYPISPNMASTGQPYGHGVNNNYVVGGPAILNSLHCPQYDGSSIGVVSSTAAGFQTNGQVGTAFGTGYVPSAHHFGHHHRPQFPGNVSFEGNPPYFYQSTDCGYSAIGASATMGAVRSDKVPVVYQSNDHGQPFACDKFMTNSVQPDNLYIDDGIATEFQTNCQLSMATCPVLNSNALPFKPSHGPQIHKNFLSIGGNRPILDKGHDRSDSVAGNNFMTQAGRSSNFSPEQIDGTFLSIKPGGSTGFQLNDHSGGMSFNVAQDVATQSDIFHRTQANDKFLSLTLNHNWGNHSWSTNESNVFNTDIHSSPFNNSQTPSRVMQHNFPLQNFGGSTDVRCANADTFEGFHDVSAIIPRPTNSNQAGLLMDQALVSRVSPVSDASVRTNVLGSMQLHQGHGNPVVSCSSELTDRCLVGDQRYVMGQYKSGQQMITNKVSSIQAANAVHNPAETRGNQPTTIGQPHTTDKGIVAQDGRRISAPPDKRRRVQMQPDNRSISSLRYQGKVVPSKGSQLAPSSKDVGVAVTNERNVLAQTSTSAPRSPPKRGWKPTAAQVLPPKSRPGSSIGPSASSSYQTAPVYHIRRKDPVDPDSSEKCALCKRDLIFSPTGPLSVPSVRPEVAVLPCHHTFHDECLQRITPKELAEDPPCIPCAIGGDG